MGQSLSEPETSKESAFCQNDYYKVGSSCMQGWRMHMEDSHTHILSLPDDPGTAFFAVYDGHGGAKVAEYAGMHLHKYVTRRPEYGTDLKRALQRAFLDLDEAMLNNEALREQLSGSTAVAVLIKENQLYCANAGDSRAIACVAGRLDVLSFDHKPMNTTEMDRICKAGGYVEYNRVNGYLALSRALGDFTLKRNQEKLPEEQMVTAFPDVEEREVSEDWDFLVIACDGIWDVLSSQSVLEFVQEEIAQGIYPQKICENLMVRCLAPDCQMGGIGGDNMTVIIVCFLHGQPYEQLIDRCKDAVAKREAKLKKRYRKPSHGDTVPGTSSDPTETVGERQFGNGRVLEDDSGSGSDSERSDEGRIHPPPTSPPSAFGPSSVAEHSTPSTDSKNGEAVLEENKPSTEAKSTPTGEDDMGKSEPDPKLNSTNNTGLKDIGTPTGAKSSPKLDDRSANSEPLPELNNDSTDDTSEELDLK
ncbi:probable protein phosphatase 2C T23F11.1 [Anopheles cruzii]|uniref:probable protein phosphatase 2C T23F11.1 n=1 Tax=Anopheles cruzii TaxID=68878 RepID=UPI0022EC7169|nr:probable protein phosphatase 2C T23F11.1 [Anopheles cruzii]XP_052868849.1 probable protein phosphatase 2C T23F11.1 [Anopheles cruzii]